MIRSTAITVFISVVLITGCTIKAPGVKVQAPGVEVSVTNGNVHCPPGQAKKGNC